MGHRLNKIKAPLACPPAYPLRIARAEHAFTLIEMIVVIALLSIILVFAIPRFSGMVSSGDTKKAARWLMVRAGQLKQTALKSQKMYMLNIDIDTGKFWVTDDAMTEEEADIAAESAYELPENIEVQDVAFPRTTPQASGQAAIRFFKNGYSDRVIVRFRDAGDRHYSVWIEPFLSTARIYEEEVEFEG